MSYLPSKKVRVVALVVLIILIGFFWYVGKQNAKNKTAESGLIYTNPELVAAQKKEADLTNFISAKIAAQGGLQNASSSDFAPKITYTAKDLKTSTDNSSASLKKYGLALKNHLVPLAKTEQNEARLTIEAIDQQNVDKVLLIEKREIEFEQMVRLLASTVVPTKAIAIHLDLINGLAHLDSLLKQMTRALEEPIVALEAAKVYAVDAVEFYNILGKTNQFFNENKIDFSEEERLKVNLGTTQ